MCAKRRFSTLLSSIPHVVVGSLRREQHTTNSVCQPNHTMWLQFDSWHRVNALPTRDFGRYQKNGIIIITRTENNTFVHHCSPKETGRLLRKLWVGGGKKTTFTATWKYVCVEVGNNKNERELQWVKVIVHLVRSRVVFVCLEIKPVLKMTVRHECWCWSLG